MSSVALIPLITPAKYSLWKHDLISVAKEQHLGLSRSEEVANSSTWAARVKRDGKNSPPRVLRNQRRGCATSSRV